MDFADYLREKYNLTADEVQTRPSTAGTSAFTSTDDLYAKEQQQQQQMRRLGAQQRPRTATAAAGAGRYTADRLSRNRRAKRAMSDVQTHNHLSNLYHLNRRIQEMYAKSGRKAYSPPGGVGRIAREEKEGGGLMAAQCDDWSGEEDAGGSPGSPAVSIRAGSVFRPGTSCTPRILGAPASPPSHNLSMRTCRPMSTPSPAHMASLAALASTAGRDAAPTQRPATTLGPSPPHGARSPRAGRQQIVAAAAAAGQVVGGAGVVAVGSSFTERRVKNTAQALKNAILTEILENRIYEEQRLKQLFRSYLKLNSGEAFYTTLIKVVEELKAELGVK